MHENSRTAFVLLLCNRVDWLQVSLPVIGTLSKKRRSRRRGYQQESFHSNGIEAGRISKVWPPLIFDRVMLLKAPDTVREVPHRRKISNEILPGVDLQILLLIVD